MSIAAESWHFYFFKTFTDNKNINSYKDQISSKTVFITSSHCRIYTILIGLLLHVLTFFHEIQVLFYIVS